MYNNIINASLSIKNFFSSQQKVKETLSEIKAAIKPLELIAGSLSICYSVLYQMEEADYSYVFSRESFLNICKLRAESISEETLTGNISEKAIRTYLNTVLRDIVEYYGNGFKFKDRLCFLFLLAMHVTKESLFGKKKCLQIPMSHIIFLLNSDIDFKTANLKNFQEEDGMINPASLWLSDSRWKSLQLLSKIPEFHGLSLEFSKYANRATTPISDSCWEEVGKALYPQRTAFPSKWESQLKNVEKILVLKCLRPEILSNVIEEYIEEVFGFPHNYPPHIYEQRHSISSSHTPILILSEKRCIINQFLKKKFWKIDIKATTFINEDGQQTIYPIGKPISISDVQELRSITDDIRNSVIGGDWIILDTFSIPMNELLDFHDSLKKISSLCVINPHFRIWILSSKETPIPQQWYLSSVRIEDENVFDFRHEFYHCFHIIADNISPKEFMPSQIYRRTLFNLCLFYSSLKMRNLIRPLNPIEKINVDQKNLMNAIKFLQMSFIDRSKKQLAEDTHYLKILYYDIFTIYFSPCASNMADIIWLKSFFYTIIQHTWLDSDGRFYSDSLVKSVFHATMKGDLKTSFELIRSHPKTIDLDLSTLELGKNIKCIIDEKETADFLKVLSIVRSDYAMPQAIKVYGKLEEKLSSFVSSLEDLLKLPVFQKDVRNMCNEISRTNNFNYMEELLITNIKIYSLLLKEVKDLFSNLLLKIVGEISMDYLSSNVLKEIIEGKVPMIIKQSEYMYPSNLSFDKWTEDFIERIRYVDEWHSIGAKRMIIHDISKIHCPNSLLIGRVFLITSYAK